MYDLLGISLALAALLTINALATILAATLWRVALAPLTARWQASTRSRMIFALRIFPALAAMLCVCVFLIPSYVAYEPRHTNETVNYKLAIVALISGIGLALALWRGLAAWLATRRLVADWMRHATPLQLEGAGIPVYLIKHKFPVIAVVGAFRPRLFIAGQVFESLSREEISAAIAHEAGHLAARDNFKRACLRACRDVLTIVPTGRVLDRAWSESAEVAADESVACAGPVKALDLASALVKIARMAPANSRPTMPAGAFLIGETISSIGWRVRRLTQLATPGDSWQRNENSMPGLLLWSGFILLIMIVAFAATRPGILAAMHSMLESIVRALN